VAIGMSWAAQGWPFNHSGASMTQRNA